MGLTGETLAIPEELLEQIERGNVLLFIGERIVRDTHGQVFHDRLAAALAKRCGLDGVEDLSFPEIARAYEKKVGPRELVEFVRNQFEALGDAPQPLHMLLASLNMCSIYATTCVDHYLERAFKAAQRPYDPVIANIDVPFGDEQKTQLYKLHGSLDRAESLVFTSNDLESFEDKSSISVVLQGYLARKTILFIGYNLADPYFRRLYRVATKALDAYARRSYVVFDVEPNSSIQMWCDDNRIEVITADATVFLETLTRHLRKRVQPVLSSTSAPVADTRVPLPTRPYKLLDYYEASDEAIFFGRQHETHELASLIHAHRLTLVYGASGVGKTSLLLAGVAPRLERVTPSYATIYVRALENPALEIRRTLRRRLPNAELPEDHETLVDFLAAATHALEQPLVIVLDQFEEFFIRYNLQVRAAFIADLGACYGARDLPVKIVLSLREDWLAVISEIEHCIPEVFRVKLRVLPLSRDQAEEAITTPIKPLGVSYEPALVEHLLEDLMSKTGNAVTPPELQLVCSALYSGLTPDERKITLADYEQLGGTQGVLQRYLADELVRLNINERALARRILEELVTSERTKSVKSGSDLALGLDVAVVTLEPLLEKLVRARLLRVLEHEDHGTAYELSHEYLIREIEFSADIQARKSIEERIKLGSENWYEFGLPARDQFLKWNEYRDKIRLTSEQKVFMLCAAIRNNFDIEYWIGQLDISRAHQIVENVVRERESWVNREDRFHALSAVRYLPVELQEELLYENVFSEDESMAQKAMAELRVQRIKGTEEYLYSVWQNGNPGQRKLSIQALIEYSSPSATEKISFILDQLPEKVRVKVVELIGETDDSDAHRLLIEQAVYDTSNEVRHIALDYMDKVPSKYAAQRIFELSVPNYRNYIRHFHETKIEVQSNFSDSRIARIIPAIVLSLFPYVIAVTKGIDDPKRITHNQAIWIAYRHFGQNALDNLFDIIERELRAKLHWQRFLLGYLFLLPLPFIFFPGLRLLAFVGPPLIVLLLFIARQKEIKVPNKFVQNRLQQIKKFTMQWEVYNYLLAQIFPLYFLFLGWLCFVAIQYTPNSSIFNIIDNILALIIIIIGFLYMLFIGDIITNCLNPEGSLQNISWFTAGPDHSVRWLTARKLARYLEGQKLLDSLSTLDFQSGRMLPIKTIKLMLSHIKKDNRQRGTLIQILDEISQNQNLILYSDSVKGFLHEDSDNTNWEEVQKIQKKLASIGYGLRTFFKILTRIIIIAVLGSVIFIIPYALINTTSWELSLGGELGYNEVWITGEQDVFRVVLHDGDVEISEQSVLAGMQVKTITCDMEEDCFVLTSDQRIGLIMSDAVDWLSLPQLSSEINTLWVARSKDGTQHIFIHVDNQLLTTADRGNSWKESVIGEDLQIEGLSPVNAQRAIAFAVQDLDVESYAEDGEIAEEVQSSTPRAVVYETSNAGATWKELQTGLPRGIEMRNISIRRHMRNPEGDNSQSISYYEIDLPDETNILFADKGDTSDGVLWRSSNGWDWQRVFASQDCSEFSSLNMITYDERLLLYRSYALTDGEQGVYVSLDRGDSWKKVIINSASDTNIVTRFFSKRHLICGTEWPWQQSQASKEA